MRLLEVQNNFTGGELDPKLRSRVDIAQYRAGLDTALNVTVQPQGGVTRREGTKHLFTIGSFDSSYAYRLVPFEFSTTDSYMLAFVASSSSAQMYVFRNRVLQTNINSSGNDFLSLSHIRANNIAECDFIQSADTLIITHPDRPVVKIVRGATNTSWTESTVSFDFIPKVAGTLTQTRGDSVGTHAVVKVGAASGKFKFEPFTDSAQTTEAEIFTSSAATYVGQYINVTPFGRLRIVRKIGSAALEVFAEIPLFDDGTIIATNWELETGYEDAWDETYSASGSYPRSATFHEGRLFFGGTKDFPSTLFGSRVGQFFNFEPGEGLADEAVQATLDTNTFNAITDVYSGQHLQVFTTGAEFYVPQGENDPITPSNFIVKQQTAFGSKPGVKVQNLDGATIFIQRQGRSLQEFLYSDVTASYQTAKISLLSSHLLNDPIDIAVKVSTSTDEGDRILIVNDDGSIACYTTLRSQNIVAASKWTTPESKFIAIGQDVEDTYVIVHRQSDDSTFGRVCVEVFDADATGDMTFDGIAVSGPSRYSTKHIEIDAAARTLTFTITVDGKIESTDTIGGGSYSDFQLIQGTNATTDNYQIGLDFPVTVKTLPADPSTNVGSLRGNKKRIFQVNASLFETQNISIDGTAVSFTTLDGTTDTAIAEYTGLKTFNGLLGYSYEPQITFTQTQPLKMTLLGVDYKMKAGS